MNAVSSVACAIILLGCTIISAAEPREIPLWPEGVPELRVPAEPAEKVEIGKDGISRRSNVSNPRLVVYDIPRADPAKLRSAVIVIPGGGFGILADQHEGSDICRWFSERGFVAFLLLHRVPTNKFENPNAGPVLDAQKAVHEVRRRADEYHLDPQKIALLGFSAGGQTALVAAANPPRFDPAAAAGSARPDAVVLIYPWKVGGPDGKGVRSDVTIDAGTPPMFIAQASNDPASLPQSAAALYLALLEAKVPAELHIYEAGGHGFGMQKRDNAAGTSDWPNRALDWLRGRGL
ncbi:MAG: alpha/beta hydrolase [Planctomycetia bacterium]|nr:alpha/beta hydrolase [Planctomycetia bacterium]